MDTFGRLQNTHHCLITCVMDGEYEGQDSSADFQPRLTSTSTGLAPAAEVESGGVPATSGVGAEAEVPGPSLLSGTDQRCVVLATRPPAP